jgi:hypothetical protein
MKKAMMAVLVTWCFTLFPADSIKVYWGMVDYNGDEFISESLEKIAFRAKIYNFGSGYNSIEISETAPGNSLQIYNGTRAACIVDFSNFSDWTWRAGDELKIVVEDRSIGSKGEWHEAFGSWIIPETADGEIELGFEDLGISGSGLPINTWYYIYKPEKIFHIGLVDFENGIFDFSAEPYDYVTFKCWVKGRSNDIIDQNSAGSGYAVYNSSASAIHFDIYDFQSDWTYGDTLNVEIKHDPLGLGYYTAGIKFSVEDNPDENIYIGLDAWLGEGMGGGIPLSVNRRVDEEFKVYWGMVNLWGQEFTDEMLKKVSFKARISNYKTGYVSNIVTDSDIGNEIINLENLRGTCVIDFNNFEEWEWCNGDLLTLDIKDSLPGYDGSYCTTYAEWYIPENAEEFNIFGFEDYLGSGGPPINYWTTHPKITDAYIGCADNNGEMFDYSQYPYDNVSFRCWITGREDAVIDQNSGSTRYINYNSLASAFKICMYDFHSIWNYGDTLNVSIKQWIPGQGYYTGEKQFIFGYTHGFSHYGPYDIKFGLDVLYDEEGMGGGDPVVADVWVAETGVEELVNIPEITALFQNYPNPFNPVTQIRFALAKTADVKLSVYNIAGQIVAELASGTRQAGIHTVDFDGSKLNSGVYYYTLEGDGKTMTKKMLLVK